MSRATPNGAARKLLDDQEIGLTFTMKNTTEIMYYAYNNPRESNNLVNIDNMGCEGGACKSIQTPTITMADLGGDDQAYPVLAFRDSEKRIAAGIRTEEGVSETWYSDQYDAQGKNVDWIDIAAGNLNGADTQDNTDEVVIAFTDDSKALQVLIPQAIDAPKKVSGYYRADTSNGHGKVEFVSVDTGDLDGDGYDNEIITAFKDGNRNLQAMIFRKDVGKDKLTTLWARSWTNHDRHGMAYKDWGTEKEFFCEYYFS